MLHTKLPGKPDIVFPSARVAVFVDGSFWHSCPAHGKIPKSNVGYWKPKLERNRTRDLTINVTLAEAGWLAIRVWEHDVLSSPGGAARNIRKLWSGVALKSIQALGQGQFLKR